MNSACAHEQKQGSPQTTGLPIHVLGLLAIISAWELFLSGFTAEDLAKEPGKGVSALVVDMQEASDESKEGARPCLQRARAASATLPALRWRDET